MMSHVTCQSKELRHSYDMMEHVTYRLKELGHSYYRRYDESCNMSIEEVESDEALLVPVARILQFICDVMR